MKFEMKIALWFGAFILFAIVMSWVDARFEARTFNRITGSHVTTWDALWVELRVMSTAMSDSIHK